MAQHEMIQDIPTRWNSDYAMMTQGGMMAMIGQGGTKVSLDSHHTGEE